MLNQSGRRNFPHPSSFFLFTAPAPTHPYTLSLHDALPIWSSPAPSPKMGVPSAPACRARSSSSPATAPRAEPPGTRKIRSEEHTSELQSPDQLVCRLLLEKKKLKHFELRRSGSGRACPVTA